jgi:putative ABC transport system permease protein
LIVGVILVVFLLPTFNSFVEKNITLSFTNIFQLTVAALILALIVGLIAGSYPAFFLSVQRPTQIFKGKTTGILKTWFLRPLVVVQFAFSAFLIMSAIVMYRQMEFVTSRDLGYNHHQVLVIRIPGRDGDRFIENFRTLVSNDRSVISVSGSAAAFTQGTLTLGYNYQNQPMSAACYIVDQHYISTLGIPLISGRNFDLHNPPDLTNAVIVNESLVKAMKWTDPLSEHLKWKFEEGPGSKVIGVVKDHHFLSLEQSIGPMFLTMDKLFDNFRYALVKLAPEDLAASVKRMEKAYKNLSPDMAFEYFFLDDSIKQQYQSYRRWINIMSVATGFAVLISCLGLFGLAGTNVANRTKEIGIRKILGSSISSLFVLLNKQFFYFSAIAFMLAVIPAWYAMNKWLMSFQYRIEISWVLYVISFGIGLVVVFFTVSFHTWRAARVNPADTLRHE